MAILPKNPRHPMLTYPRKMDWLEEIRELNRLFLGYLSTRARTKGHCMNLPRPVAKRLGEATPDTLDRLAELPTALFRLRVDAKTQAREHIAPQDALEQMRVCVTVTILSSAWHLARSRPFEARMFLHLPLEELLKLRAMSLLALPSIAYRSETLSCAYADKALAWPAFMRMDQHSDERLLTLIALQPQCPGNAPVVARPSPIARSATR